MCVCVCVCVYYKELAHVIMEAGKSQDLQGWQARDPGRADVSFQVRRQEEVIVPAQRKVTGAREEKEAKKTSKYVCKLMNVEYIK